MVLLVVVAWNTGQTVSRRALLAAGAITALLCLSAASLLWAQSKENAWTDTNRLILYVVVFAIGVLSIRDRRTARAILVLLGLAALITAVWFPLRFVLGGGAFAFLQHRLSSPIGYINGTAGLLVMGIWVWLAYAETAQRRELRAAAFGAATMIAGTFILTQSRAVLPATLLSAILVLACAPGRTRRAVNLLTMAFCVVLGLHWTLAVYSEGGAAARGYAPSHGVLRGAGIAILLGGLLASALSYGLSTLRERIEPRRRAHLSRRLGIAMLTVTVLATGTAVVVKHSYISTQWHDFKSLKVNQNATDRFVDASGFRYDLWRIAWKEFTQHPIGGVGAGNYDREYYKLRKNPQYIVQPHSLEMQMLAELGIFGFLALLTFCGTVLASGFARRDTLASEDMFIRIGALGVFGAWLIDTSVDWLYDIPGLTCVAMLAAALLVIPARRGGEAATEGGAPGRVRSRSSQVLLVSGLGALALLAASVGRQYAASRYTSSGTSSIMSNPRRALSQLRTAAKLDPYSLQTLYSIAQAYARLDDYQGAHAALQLASQKEPSNYVPPALLGDLAMRRGLYAAALLDYQHALALDPHDPQIESSIVDAQTALKG
jgi:hypothetical protein